MSGKMSRNKGMQYERDLYNFFEAEGFEPIKRNRGGFDGDDLRLANPDCFSIEAKNQKTRKLASWVDQATEQAKEGSKLAIVIHKRTGTTDINKHFVTMEAWVLDEILIRANRVQQTYRPKVIIHRETKTRAVDLAGILEDSTGDLLIISHPRQDSLNSSDDYMTTTVMNFMTIARMLQG